MILKAFQYYIISLLILSYHREDRDRALDTGSATEWFFFIHVRVLSYPFKFSSYLCGITIKKTEDHVC